MLKNISILDNFRGLWLSVNRKIIKIKVYQKRDVFVRIGNNLVKIIFKYKAFRVIKVFYKLRGFILFLKSILSV